MLILLFYLGNTLERNREAARFLLQLRLSCFPDLPGIKLRTSQSVNILKNALYKHFKLSNLKDKTFNPFLVNLFLDRMI